MRAATGFGLRSLELDPRLARPASLDFHPLPGSPEGFLRRLWEIELDDALRLQ